MRTDASVSRMSFRHSEQWRTDPFAGVQVPEIDRRLAGYEIVDGRMVVHSLSGHERNHLFLNQEGQRFTDISPISGLDNPADSRGFVLLDYDHDGQQDIALVNANDPLLNLYHNQIGDEQTSSQNRFIAVRFVGGNRTPAPSKTACRDGYGAVATLKLASGTLRREHRCGEGYGTQNSATMLMGIGDEEQAESLEVRWPSGKTSHVANIPSGMLITVYEDPAEGKEGAVLSPYAAISSRDVVRSHHWETMQLGDLEMLPELQSPSDPRPRLYVTTATWCVACIDHLPHMRHLSDVFGDDVRVIGLPIDPNDDAAKLRQFAARYHLPYSLVLSLAKTDRTAIAQALRNIVPSDAVPASILIDDQGRIRMTMAGVPTVSEVRRALVQNSPSP